MGHAERAIVSMLRLEAAKYPILLKYIRAIEAGYHLQPHTKSKRATREISAQDVLNVLAAMQEAA